MGRGRHSYSAAPAGALLHMGARLRRQALPHFPWTPGCAGSPGAGLQSVSAVTTGGYGVWGSFGRAETTRAR
jgi:hypothetical protein